MPRNVKKPNELSYEEIARLQTDAFMAEVEASHLKDKNFTLARLLQQLEADNMRLAQRVKELERAVTNAYAEKAS